MKYDRQGRLQKIVQAAGELEGDEREAYLAKACSDDPELRTDVEAFFEHDMATEALGEDVDVFSKIGTQDLTNSPRRFETIGPYRLLEILGSGGMGVVYLAEQSEPVRRQVALKLIKRGMDTHQVIARFEAERQALALMDHPCISRVLDAGASEDGRPYFVMELVRGMPITDYCKAEELGTRQRLELVARVCDALQHAHQKGIIHRDLKSSNILVETRDGKATPKIIDFGLAKATDHRLTERTLFTESGQIMGTPEYMSPEQASGRVFDVDTRSDIYSMGVVLYELLTGTLPFIIDRQRSAGLAEIQRIVTEEEPLRPSTRVSRAATNDTPASPAMARELKGDLDWIVMKAMDKERNRRYSSASELAVDIRNYLADRPVLAAAPSTSYRLRKFARRHRKAVLGAALTLVILLGGIVTTTWQALRATKAEAEAVTQTELVSEVNEFLVSMLAEASPEYNPDGRQMTVLEALDTAARLIEVRKSSPQLEAEVRRVVASTFCALGRHQEAEDQARAGLQALKQAPNAKDEDFAQFHLELGRLALVTGKYEEATSHFSETISAVSKDDANHLITRAQAIHGLGRAAKGTGDTKEAMRFYKSALEMLKGLDHQDALKVEAQALTSMSSVDTENMDYTSAETHARRALELKRSVYGEPHPEISDSLTRLATLLSLQGETEAADKLFRKSLEMNRLIYGDKHLRIGIALAAFGEHLTDHDPELAETYLREATEILEHSGYQSGFIGALDRLASLLLSLESLDEAEALFQRSLKIKRGIVPENLAAIAGGLNNLAAVYRKGGRFDDAVPMFEEALGLFLRLVGNEHPVVARMEHNLGKTLLDAGRAQEALPRLQSAFDLAKNSFPENNLELAVIGSTYGACLVRLSRPEQAEALLTDAYNVISGQLGKDHHRSQEVAGYLDELNRSVD